MISEGTHVDHDETLSFHCSKDFSIVEDGKILNDVRVDVTCSDGTWSKDLHCKQTSCLGDPPKIERGKEMVSDRSHGKTIWYKCDNPKDRKIEGNVTCHFGTWIGIPPQCRSLNSEQSRPTVAPPLQSNIGDKTSTPSTPSNPHNSNIQPPEQCHCTYVGAGYHVQATVGNKRLKDGDKVRQGLKVTLSCRNRGVLTWRNGFRTYGNVNMTCTSCQRWEAIDNPECKTLEGGGPFISLGNSLEMQPGGAVEVRIKKLISLRCASSRHYPQWLFNGQPVRDVEYFPSQNGHLVLYFTIINIYEAGYGHAGLYTCQLNLPGNFQRTAVELRVKENKCPLLAGQFLTNSMGNEIGNWATFSCPEDTILVGDRQIVCQEDGTWSSPEPYCRAIECTFFPTVQDLKVSYSDGNQVGSRARFTCPTHATLVGSAISDCTSDGTWSFDIPYCLNKTTCATFRREPGLRIKYSNGNVPGSNASFICSFDKVLNGHSFAVCLENGDWSNPVPSCEDKTTCATFRRVPGLRIKYSNGNIPGSNASFSCLSADKVLNGNSFAVCLENGDWSHPVPSCEDKCSIELLSRSVKEGVIPDMSVATEEFVPFGSTVPLACEEKFIPEGNSTAVCGEQGRWKVGKFECVSGCRLNIDPSSNLQVQHLKDSYRFGENVVLSCPEGEKMTSDVEVLMCMGQLKWSEPIPNCIKS